MIQKIKTAARRFDQFCLLATLLLHVLKHCRHERFLQYLRNRLPTESNTFNLTDEWVLDCLKRKDAEFELEAGRARGDDGKR